MTESLPPGKKIKLTERNKGYTALEASVPGGNVIWSFECMSERKMRNTKLSFL